MDFSEIFEDLQNNPEAFSSELNEKQAINLLQRVIASEPLNKTQQKHNQQLVYLEKALNSDLQKSLDLLQCNYQQKLQVDSFIQSLLYRLHSRALYSLIEGKTLIGVGGRFSSGKSSFLNALFMQNSELQLPESQDTTTSVPTFLINSNNSKKNTPEFSAQLCNHYGEPIELTSLELNAISHSFKNRFGLGLSEFVSFINITTPIIPPDVAMLDTPGYSKDDGNQMAQFSDFSKAYEQLKSVDYLIWVFDIANGTITDEDFKFIRQIKPQQQILIIANKSDLKPETERNAVIQQAKLDATQRLAEFGCELFDIVPFSSRKLDSHKDSIATIQNFLEAAKLNKDSRESLLDQLEEQYQQVIQLIEVDLKEREQAFNSLMKEVKRSNQVFSLQNLSSLLRNRSSIYYDLRMQRHQLKHSKAKSLLKAIIQ